MLGCDGSLSRESAPAFVRLYLLLFWRRSLKCQIRDLLTVHVHPLSNFVYPFLVAICLFLGSSGCLGGGCNSPLMGSQSARVGICLRLGICGRLVGGCGCLLGGCGCLVGG